MSGLGPPCFVGRRAAFRLASLTASGQAGVVLGHEC